MLHLDMLHPHQADRYISWGLGQTFSCGIPDTCPRINCADLGQNADKPGSGPAYAVLLSFANFNLHMQTLWEAVNLGKNDWNGVQVKLQQTYWPYNTRRSRSLT